MSCSLKYFYISVFRITDLIECQRYRNKMYRHVTTIAKHRRFVTEISFNDSFNLATAVPDRVVIGIMVESSPLIGIVTIGNSVCQN